MFTPEENPGIPVRIGRICSKTVQNFFSLVVFTMACFLDHSLHWECGDGVPMCGYDPRSMKDETKKMRNSKTGLST